MPTRKTIQAYKVFEIGDDEKPMNYGGDTIFEFGTILWNQRRANKEDFGDQIGFQMFAYKKDALEYAGGYDKVCTITVKKEHIAKVGKTIVMPSRPKAYEITQFEFTEEMWKNGI